MISKEAALERTLSWLGAVVVAYSGGVDSAYLAFVAGRTLGDRAWAVTADSASYPERHRAMAIQIAERFGLRHEIIRTHEIDRPEYRANPVDRCYYCKHELYTELSRIAAERQAPVVDGNNADDRGDYRPGRQAAREFGVRSPLDEVDLTKNEIRQLSKRAGLPSWDEPASARPAARECGARRPLDEVDLTKNETRRLPNRAGLRTWDEPASACLSSRIPYH